MLAYLQSEKSVSGSWAFQLEKIISRADLIRTSKPRVTSALDIATPLVLVQPAEDQTTSCPDLLICSEQASDFSSGLYFTSLDDTQSSLYNNDTVGVQTSGFSKRFSYGLDSTAFDDSHPSFYNNHATGMQYSNDIACTYTLLDNDNTDKSYH